MNKPKSKSKRSRWFLGALASVFLANTALLVPEAKAQSESESACPPSPGYFAVPSPISNYPNPDGTRFCRESRVILTYGPFQVPILVRDLKTFAETGATTKTIRQIIGASGLEADTLRGLMSLEVGFDLVPFACMLYTQEGQDLTDAVGTTIRTHRGKAGIPYSTVAVNGKAIRAALINAVSDDGKLSFLDIISYYPVPGAYVDIANVPQTVEKVQGLAGDLNSLFRQASRFSKAGCSLQEVDLPNVEPAPPTPRTPAPAPVPLPRPIPPVPPAPPVRGLW